MTERFTTFTGQLFIGPANKKNGNSHQRRKERRKNMRAMVSLGQTTVELIPLTRDSR
jgi:hypothetical protein